MYRSAFGEFANKKTEQVYIEALRRLSLEQRWQAVAALRQVAVDMVRDAVRVAHPTWNEREINWETTRQVMEAHGLRLPRSVPSRSTSH